MVLAALISFGLLLIAWILAPADETRFRRLVAAEPTTATAREAMVEVA